MTGRSYLGLTCLLVGLGCGGGEGGPDTGVVTRDGPAAGDAGSDDGPVSAPPLGPPSPLAGVWSGLTNQDLPASLVVGEDGLLTDVAVRVQVHYEDGGWCSINLQTTRLVPLRDGAAKLELRSRDLSGARIAFELRVGDDGTITGSAPALMGPFNVFCGSDAMASTPAVDALTVKLRRTGDRFRPGAEDERVVGRAGVPLPVAGCSHQPASPHAVCAFARRNELGEGELWVVDTTRPVPATCGEVSDGASSCQRLTSNLFMESAGTGLAADQRFVGDTLIFAAEPDRNARSEGASLFAWRPGWGAPLRLVDAGLGCSADERSDAIACLGRLPVGPGGPQEAELFAGRLGDGSTPPARVTRILLRSTAERAGMIPAVGYGYAVSYGGDRVLWSARTADQPDAKLVLWSAPVANPAAATMVASDVFSWRLSPEGKKLFWLRGPPPQPGELPGRRLGMLEMTDVAAATPAVTLSTPTVLAYNLTGTDEDAAVPVVALQGGGDLSHSPDVNASAPTWITVDRGVAAIRSWPPGGRRLSYAKLIADGAPGWGDLHVADLASRSAPCTVSVVEEWGSPVFSSTGNHIFAARLNEDERLTHSDAALIDARDCQVLHTHLQVRNWQRIPDGRFLLATGNHPLRKFGLATLGALDPARPSDIVAMAQGASLWYAKPDPIKGPTQVELWYAVAAGWASDGLYRRRLRLLGP